MQAELPRRRHVGRMVVDEGRATRAQAVAPEQDPEDLRLRLDAQLVRREHHPAEQRPEVPGAQQPVGDLGVHVRQAVERHTARGERLEQRDRRRHRAQRFAHCDQQPRHFVLGASAARREARHGGAMRQRAAIELEPVGVFEHRPAHLLADRGVLARVEPLQQVERAPVEHDAAEVEDDGPGSVGRRRSCGVG